VRRRWDNTPNAKLSRLSALHRLPQAVPRWLLAVPRWLQAVPRWLQAVPRWLQAAPRRLQAVPRWLQAVLRWLQAVLRWLQAVPRWLQAVSRWPWPYFDAHWPHRHSGHDYEIDAGGIAGIGHPGEGTTVCMPAHRAACSAPNGALHAERRRRRAGWWSTRTNCTRAPGAFCC